MPPPPIIPCRACGLGLSSGSFDLLLGDEAGDVDLLPEPGIEEGQGIDQSLGQDVLGGQLLLRWRGDCRGCRGSCPRQPSASPTRCRPILEGPPLEVEPTGIAGGRRRGS